MGINTHKFRHGDIVKLSTARTYALWKQKLALQYKQMAINIVSFLMIYMSLPFYYEEQHRFLEIIFDILRNIS